MSEVVMKLAVVSDSHWRNVADGQELVENLLTGPFATADAVLHAGDLVTPDAVLLFAPLPLYAVAGNCDSGSDLPTRRLLRFGRWRIGLVHGWGPPAGLEQRVLQVFADQTIDVLVFGHSHVPLCRRIGSLLLLNPGSLTAGRGAMRRSAALLYLGDQDVRAEVIDIDACQ
ncbi:MAG: metallophosphoesterase [Desulfuromonas thiophila]|nr:metallophosphoesterase [Desulfuromonas thiophila]MDY0398090.1 metallophosphoesterase [Desulfuromonas thiophila]